MFLTPTIKLLRTHPRVEAIRDAYLNCLRGVDTRNAKSTFKEFSDTQSTLVSAIVGNSQLSALAAGQNGSVSNHVGTVLVGTSIGVANATCNMFQLVGSKVVTHTPEAAQLWSENRNSYHAATI